MSKVTLLCRPIQDDRLRAIAVSRLIAEHDQCRRLRHCLVRRPGVRPCRVGAYGPGPEFRSRVRSARPSREPARPNAWGLGCWQVHLPGGERNFAPRPRSEPRSTAAWEAPSTTNESICFSFFLGSVLWRSASRSPRIAPSTAAAAKCSEFKGSLQRMPKLCYGLLCFFSEPYHARRTTYASLMASNFSRLPAPAKIRRLAFRPSGRCITSDLKRLTGELARIIQFLNAGVGQCCRGRAVKP